ncbi:hypothetical protein D3C83_159030 [compost metagenome]
MPLWLKSNSAIARPEAARRSASGGNSPQSLKPLKPWQTTATGSGRLSPAGA